VGAFGIALLLAPGLTLLVLAASVCARPLWYLYNRQCTLGPDSQL